MSKAVLISIRPKWVELIASGRKTIEVRKTAPKIETPFKCYVYQTLSKSGYLNKGDGHVVGEFVCNEIQRYARYGQFKEPARYMKSSPGGYPATEIHYASLQLSPGALEQYGKGAPLYGLCISDLVIYDEPKNLSEFCRPCCERVSDCGTCQKFDRKAFSCKRNNTATRPPQSYMYVEELTT